MKNSKLSVEELAQVNGGLPSQIKFGLLTISGRSESNQMKKNLLQISISNVFPLTLLNGSC